jgi:lysophospholipase L1-like esterase
MMVRSMLAFSTFVAAALILVGTGPAHAQAIDAGDGDMPAACRVPAAVFVDEAKLPHVARRVAKDRRLVVVALGSSSTLGSGASAPSAAWPIRLEADLRRRLSGVDVTVHNSGRARDDAGSMVRRMPADVLALKPDIVIWETGTAEAMRHREVELFSEHLQSGIDLIVKAGADVMLVTPQYSRETARLIAYQPYIDAMNSIGMRRDVLLFPRFDVMRHWVESGQMQLDNVAPAQSVAIADRVYDCIGRQLARVFVRAMSMPKAR